MRFTPHVTVACVIEKDGRFLFVEEHAEGREVLNQPAGHLEADESLTQAAVRETLEETGWDVEITAVVGLYLFKAPTNGVTYQRVCFAGRALAHHPEHALDEGIIGPRWLSRAELLERRADLRSELVLRCLDDYLSGETFPLALIRERL